MCPALSVFILDLQHLQFLASWLLFNSVIFFQQNVSPSVTVSIEDNYALPTRYNSLFFLRSIAGRWPSFLTIVSANSQSRLLELYSAETDLWPNSSMPIKLPNQANPTCLILAHLPLRFTYSCTWLSVFLNIVIIPTHTNSSGSSFYVCHHPLWGNKMPLLTLLKLSPLNINSCPLLPYSGKETVDIHHIYALHNFIYLNKVTPQLPMLQGQKGQAYTPLLKKKQSLQSEEHSHKSLFAPCPVFWHSLYRRMTRTVLNILNVVLQLYLQL